MLVRNDLVGQVRNVDPPRDLTEYITSQSLGDEFGEVRYAGDRALFVHPGASRPTTFDLDLAAYEAASGRRQVQLTVSVARTLPPESLARGGGRVRARAGGVAVDVRAG